MFIAFGFVINSWLQGCQGCRIIISVQGSGEGIIVFYSGREANKDICTMNADGKYLFFSSGERGKGDIYWVMPRSSTN